MIRGAWAEKGEGREVGGEEEGEDLEVEVEAAPGGRPVLRHTRDDGNTRNKTG